MQRRKEKGRNSTDIWSKREIMERCLEKKGKNGETSDETGEACRDV